MPPPAGVLKSGTVTTRRARSTSPATAIVTIILTAAVVLGAVLNLSNPAGLLAYLPYAIVGSVLVVRRPGHKVGWLLLLLAMAFSTVGSSGWLGHAIATGNAALLPLIAWIGTMSGIGLFVGMAWLTAVFPTGALPRGVTGLATRIALTVTAGLAVLQAVDPVFSIALPDGTPIVVSNPIGIGRGWAGWSLLDGPAYGVVLLALTVCIVGLLVRFRRATGVERQQDKWLLGSLALVAIAVTSGLVSTFLFDGDPAWAWIPAGLTFPLPPVAIGIAILRFRLYEIDRIVSRTITYGLVTAMLLASYAALILLLQASLVTITGGDTLSVAVATLVAAALFQPLRRRIQEGVDRRFNRSRYDSERAVLTFTARLRDEMQLPHVTSALLDAAVRTVQPTAVRVWVRSERPDAP